MCCLNDPLCLRGKNWLNESTASLNSVQLAYNYYVEIVSLFVVFVSRLWPSVQENTTLFFLWFVFPCWAVRLSVITFLHWPYPLNAAPSILSISRTDSLQFSHSFRSAFTCLIKILFGSCTVWLSCVMEEGKKHLWTTAYVLHSLYLTVSSCNESGNRWRWTRLEILADAIRYQLNDCFQESQSPVVIQ